MKFRFRHLCCLGLTLLNVAVWGQENRPVPGNRPQPAMTTNQQKVIEFLLTKILLQQDHNESPGNISGNLQHGYNRIDSGWLIYLHSPPEALQTVDAEIQLNMVTVRLVTCIQDLLDKEYFRGYNLKVPVAPGQFRILHVQTESFEPDLEKYYQHPQSLPK